MEDGKAVSTTSDAGKKKKAGVQVSASVEEVIIEGREEAADLASDDPFDRQPTNMRKNRDGGDVNPLDKGLSSRDKGNCISMGTDKAVSSAWDADIDPHQGLRSPASILGMDHLLENVVVTERYKTLKKLGEGGFGQVMEVTPVSAPAKSKETIALKIIPLERLHDKTAFLKELSIAAKMKHPHICLLYEFFQDEENVYLAMELCPHGDLFDKIKEGVSPITMKAFGLTQEVVAPYMWQMLSGIAYLHLYRFAHRDLKPENYMIVKTPGNFDESTLKLIDFGLAKSFKKGEMLHSKVGTLSYAAPELLSGTPYTERCDLWSIGVVMVVMLTGSHPFLSNDDKVTLKNIRENQINWADKRWEGRPKEARGIITSLLKSDPAERTTAKIIIQEDQWLRKKHSGDGGGCCTAM